MVVTGDGRCFTAFGHFKFPSEPSVAEFHEGIVIAIVNATRALADTVMLKHCAVRAAGVLAAVVGVTDLPQIGRGGSADRTSLLPR